MPKNVQTTITIALISHVPKVMFKILQARPQQYVNREIPDVKAEFGKCQFSFQSQRQAIPKNIQTTTQLHSFHTLAK